MMTDEIRNEVAEEVAETIMENIEIPDVVRGRGFNKTVAFVAGTATAIGVSAIALWKNRKKIADHFEKKQVARMTKKGYVVTKMVNESDGIKLVPVEEESK